MERSLTEPNFEPDHNIVPGHWDLAYQGRRLLTLACVHEYYRTYEWAG
jgi:hypothetical protein